MARPEAARFFRMVLVAALIAGSSHFVLAQSAGRPVPAPPLDGGVEWINTDAPIRLADLRGKIVILDFWTYCCINCLQTLPDLKQLEQAYSDELVVIGIHAPKFAGERDTQNIRDAVLRHGVEHPVVNDANYTIARRYGVEGWPSLRVIDPEGNVIDQHYGEITFEVLDAFMKRAVVRYRKVLDRRPLQFLATTPQDKSTPLRYPGKVLAEESSQRLFIADSGHNRIVMASWEGRVLEVIGTGERGRRDGTFEDASFSAPQGMALAGDTLLLADTENHLIRRLDLAARTVSTVAGTGRQGTTVVVRGTRQPTAQDLASPWDVAVHDDWLYIAMAGTHQIWRMSLKGDFLQTFAGSGTEDIVDGPLRPRQAFGTGVAAFAQPSGLALGDGYLYIADSEGSSIRAIELDPNGDARTLLGTQALAKAQRLFTFGDRDGPLMAALLQHPMGIARWENQLLVADTYNDKIKAIDLEAATIRTLVAGGDGDPSGTGLDEPAGLSAAAGRLFIADTNNHAIRVLNLAGGSPLETLEFNELQPPTTVRQDTEKGHTK